MQDPTASERDAAHDRYETVIGLEVHAQLLTRSKAFSPEAAEFGAEPNEHVDPVSLGHPGTLPVLNEQVVDYTLRMGLATHCQIRERSIFARKHYFYPDLPKGYQISQYDTPICHDGWVEIDLSGEDQGDEDAEPTRKRIGITRIHMEEDSGKSQHDQDPYDTLVDYNRAGVTLIEIVSEPDIRSPREAYRYLQKIRQVVRYLGICDGNMEEGSLRCDANLSVRPWGQKTLGTKTEVKNLNSFRNVERALLYERERQIQLLEEGGEVVQQTLLWDESAHETRPLRSKEEAHDYRYFPDPDLVQVVVTEDLLDHVRSELPELPESRRRRYTSELSLPAYDAALLTEERALSDYFEATLGALRNAQPNGDEAEQAKAVSNFVMGDVRRVLNEQALDVESFPVPAPSLAALIALRLDDAVSSSAAQELFDALVEQPDADPAVLAEQRNLLQVSDEGALVPLVDDVLARFPDKVEAYRGGKHGLLGFFIGQVMRTFEGAPDPKLVRELLTERLSAEEDAT